MKNANDNPICQLDRFPLSVILSFLTETEGCSLLITNRKWTSRILPQFRLRETKSMMISIVSPNNHKRVKHRHKFVIAPVQDSLTMLDRLNTRRWKKRKLQHSTTNMTTSQKALQEWQNPTAFPPLLRFWPLQSATNVSESPFRPGITVLVSYPRSGNTLLRSLLESVTGIVTASDTRADRTLSQALAKTHGLVGEGLCRPPICKTHWPERIGCQKFKAQRAIVVVRNPFDAIISYWNLNLTNTHTEKVTNEVYERFQDFFQALVKNEMKVWLDFLNFWLNNSSIPILAIRYEDLILNPRPQLEQILDFYAPGNGKNVGVSYWRKRLDTVITNKKFHGYRSASSMKANTSIGRSISERFSNELLQTLHDMDSDGWLKYFGYHVYDQGFPRNLSSLPPLVGNIDSSIETQSTGMLINQSEIDLRPAHSPYGRKMRDWRRKHTKDDTKPFPIS